VAGYFISPEAEQELDDIWAYLVLHASLRAADKVVDSIIDEIIRLGENPNTGTPHDEQWKPGLRSAVAGSYVIVHRLDADQTVIVLRIVHGSRDIMSVLAEMPDE
jgi:plasmid stabilization system protein ParE